MESSVIMDGAVQRKRLPVSLPSEDGVVYYSAACALSPPSLQLASSQTLAWLLWAHPRAMAFAALARDGGRRGAAPCCCPARGQGPWRVLGLGTGCRLARQHTLT